MSNMGWFRLNPSVNTCNPVFTDYVFDAFAIKNQVDVIYTDFSKAIDRVNHSVLMKVLVSSGFEESLVPWFSSYLSYRKQFVKIFGIKSQVLNTLFRVPQCGHIILLIALKSYSPQ